MKSNKNIFSLFYNNSKKKLKEALNEHKDINKSNDYFLDIKKITAFDNLENLAKKVQFFNEETIVSLILYIFYE